MKVLQFLPRAFRKTHLGELAGIIKARTAGRDPGYRSDDHLDLEIVSYTAERVVMRFTDPLDGQTYALTLQPERGEQ